MNKLKNMLSERAVESFAKMLPASLGKKLALYLLQDTSYAKVRVSDSSWAFQAKKPTTQLHEILDIIFI